MAQDFNRSSLTRQVVFAILEFLNQVRQQLGEAVFLGCPVVFSQDGFQYSRAPLVFRFCVNHVRESITEEMRILLNVCDLGCWIHFFQSSSSYSA
jgi:hypothetical protein